jgi:hypothetical protein
VRAGASQRRTLGVIGEEDHFLNADIRENVPNRGLIYG